jgi:hypothetical protein
MKKLGTFVCAFVAAGCVSSEPIYLSTPDAGGQPIISNATGAGGQVGGSGQAGSTIAATTGSGGNAAGGTSGTAGAGGVPSTTGTGGAGGQGGQTTSMNDAGATGGSKGSTVDARPAMDAGAVDATSPYAATWTDIYNKMFNNMGYASNCTGGGCHNPGTQKGLDLSTQAKGYTTVKTKLVAGNPGASSLINQLSGGRMPQGRPKMSTADLNVVKAWIMAGALNN